MFESRLKERDDEAASAVGTDLDDYPSSQGTVVQLTENFR